MTTVLAGSADPETLTALDSDDHILRGHGGADLLTGAAADDRLYGGDGDDRLVSRGGNDSLAGGLGDDDFTLTGTGRVTVLGGGGDDFFEVLLPIGADPGAMIDGGGGVDEFRSADATADYLVDLAAGIASGHGSSMTLLHFEIVHTEGGNDTLIGAGNSTLYAHGGDDQIFLGWGGGAAYGGHGKDLLTGGDGANLIFGGENADTLYGGAGNDTLNAALGSLGDPGLESLFGGPGHDEILGGNSAISSEFYGGVGNDTLTSGALIGAADQYFGGDGRDRAIFGAATSGGVFRMGPDDTFEIGGIDCLMTEIEDLVTTGFDDYVIGSATGNRIEAGNGDDKIQGGGGNDSLFGGNGDDYFDQLTGVVSVFGDDGDDRIYLAGAIKTGGLIDGGAGSGDLVAAGDNSVDWRFDLAAGTATAGGRVQVLIGIEAATGANGDDTLIGNALANDLSGLRGSDLLIGGADRDTLTGGEDADVFVFATVEDSGIGAAADVIADFGFGDDLIDLTGFGGLIWRDQAAFVIGGGQVRQANPDGPDWVLQIDVNGDTITDCEIVLQFGTAISASDLLL